MTDLALLAQLGQRFHRSLEGDCIVGSVKLMNVDAINAQTLQTSFERLSEMFGAGVVRPLAWTWALPPALCRDDQTGRIRIERFCDQRLRCLRAIGIRS